MLKTVLKWLTDRDAALIRKKNRRDARRLRKWIRAGKPVPPPHIVKRLAIEEYARTFGVTTFVETGTFRGDMIEAVSPLFSTIFSIELDEALYNAARERFAGRKHISLLQGDSSKVLPGLLVDVNEPCLFWLDGHYSGDETSKGTSETPIVEELTVIFNHPVKSHIILIDDAREFTSNRNYPTVTFLREYIEKYGRGYTMEIKDDIIRLIPKT
jgi:hypothetical protein